MEEDPTPLSSNGALAGQMRPKALLFERPSGLLTPVYCWVFAFFVVDVVEPERAVGAEHLDATTEGRCLCTAAREHRGDTQSARAGWVDRKNGPLLPDIRGEWGAEVRPAADEEAVRIEHRASLDVLWEQGGYRMSACRRDRVIEKRADLRHR